MNIALYPGSFDPFTKGHLSVLEKAVNLFDFVIVAISTNPAKKPRFEDWRRCYAIIKMLETKSYKSKVRVIVTTDSIPARIAQNYNCNYIIRGIRNDMDYNYEEGLAQYNKEFNHNIETIYFRADNSVISSTMVYSFMKEDVDVSEYLPYDVDILETKTVQELSDMENYVIEYMEESKKWLSVLQVKVE